MKDIDLNPSITAIRTTVLGIVISAVLILIKGIAGHFGQSYALIADATESGADILSSALLWIGLRIAVKEPDTEHPYGHGKAEPLAAIVVGLFLLAAAAWIGYHAVGFIDTPHALPKKFTLWILLIVIVVKETLYRYVLSIGRKIDSQAVKADAVHHRSDAITSIAAFIGISVAIIGGKGYEGADDWAALVASVLIVYNAVGIIRPALAEIMDAAPSNEIVQKVRTLSAAIPGVRSIETCYVRKMGFDYFVDLHIEVDGELTVTKGHAIAHAVKDELLRSSLRIKDALIHVEPAGD